MKRTVLILAASAFAAALPAADPFTENVVFRSGEGGYHTY